MFEEAMLSPFMMAPPSVLITTPAYGGLVTIGYLKSVIGILDLCDRSGIQADTLLVGGEAAITRGRSNLAATFLKTGFEVMAFLDADIEIDAADFLKLLRLDKSVRGAAVSLKTADHSEMLNVYLDGERVKRAEMPAEPFECQFLGGAVMFIKREVIETLSRIPELQYHDNVVGDAAHIFAEQIVDGCLESEDYAFCSRAREYGFSVWCDPSVVCGHTGPSTWRH